MSDVMSTLKTLCDSYKAGEPFAAVVDGRRFVVATNGFALLGIASARDARTDGPNVAAIWKPASKWITASLPSLRAWLSEGRDECSECHGERYVETDRVGFSADGSGPHFDDLYERCGYCRIRPGQILGSSYDRNLALRFLAPVGGSYVDLAVAEGAPPHAPLLMRGDNWIAAVMSMSRIEGPIFPLRSP